MRLLIVTQKVDTNDPNLGFFVSWIKEFSKHADVTVIGNEVGSYAPLRGVEVYSLGKEKGASRLLRLFRYRKLLWKLLPKVDGIFFHMCPEYVLAGKLLPKLFGKKSILWYTHKEVSLRLRIAAALVDKICTASPESFRLANSKVEVVGHGVDTELFNAPPSQFTAPHLVTVGRIAPVKDIRTLILATEELRKKIPQLKLSVIGEPITTSDRAYGDELARMAPWAEFTSAQYGSVYRAGYPYNAFIHASKTGSLDKAVLEALASGLSVFTSSEAFSEATPGLTKFEEGNPHDLAEKISSAFAAGKIGYNAQGREWVKTYHSLQKLIPRIIAEYDR